MDHNTIHDDIREMRRMLNVVAESQVRTETVSKELKERLFDSTMGSVPVLFAKCAKNEAATVTVQSQLDKQKYYVLGLAGGITGVLGIVRYILSKIGIHI